jgi:ankyrin repeat protein
MQAAACGRVSAVSWLLTNGAAVDQRDANGWTALDHAFKSNADNYSLSLVKRLLAAQLLRK